MRVMMIVKASEKSEAGAMPTEENFAEMGAYNAELVAAGVMLDGMGLQSSAVGARVVFEGGKKRIVDGPFAETKELIAGFWMLQVKDMDEAKAWALKCPNPNFDGSDTNIELRRVFEMDDFGESPAIDEMKKLQTGSLS